MDNECQISAGTSNDDVTIQSEYHVEKIVAMKILHKRSRRTVYYKVKWTRYGDEHNSWQNLDTLLPGCAKLVHEFHLTNQEMGESPITPAQLRCGKRNPSVMHNYNVWLSIEDMYKYINDEIKKDNVNWFNPNFGYETVDGMNCGVLLEASHAFIVVIVQDQKVAKREVYISDSANYFTTKEGTDEHRTILNKVLATMKTKEAFVIKQQLQTREDTCAYATLCALEKFMMLVQETGKIPTLLTYPTKHLEKTMKYFGRNPRESRTVKMGQFEGINGDRVRTCSYCGYTVNRGIKAIYRARRIHELKHREPGDTSILRGFTKVTSGQ